jgi:energy-converting hydrogenase B subunit Q
MAKVEGVSITAEDRKGLLRDISGIITSHGANIRYVQQMLRGEEALLYFEIEEVGDLGGLLTELEGVESVSAVERHPPFEAIYGKRVIVIGGGAQVSQVATGAVSEADRHNLRGERISVDTIALAGEEKIAEAVKAVGRLPRVGVLVLAGSLMGGEVTKAVRELREKYGIPVISLNMAGSVTEACDLVVTDPIQAGVMAVMTVADTAKFDLAKVQGRRF